MKLNNNQLAPPKSQFFPTIAENKGKIFAGIAAYACLTTLYYLYLKPALHIYHADVSYIQKSIKCINERKPSMLSGCSNNVYCEKLDPFYIKPLGGIGGNPVACSNDVNSVLYEGSKYDMHCEVNKYHTTTNSVQQKIDKIYFKTFL